MAKQLQGKFCLIPGEKLCGESWMYTKNILDGHNSHQKMQVCKN